MTARWVVVATLPQVGGGVRHVAVRARDAAEVRRVLREDPSRVERLWVPVRVTEAP